MSPNLHISLLLLVVLAVYHVAGKQDGSCEERCGDLYDPKMTCQCDSMCSMFNECCTDYNSQCGKEAGSCKNRCGDLSDPSLGCQCGSRCTSFGDCCEDYTDFCATA